MSQIGDTFVSSCATYPYFPDYRSLRSTSHMPVKCAYLPEKSIHNSHHCISRMGQQTCIGLNNVVLLSCRVWVKTASALCHWRVPGELSVWLWSQQLVLQLTSHHDGPAVSSLFTAGCRTPSQPPTLITVVANTDRADVVFTYTTAAFPSLRGERAVLSPHCLILVTA